MTTSSNIRQRAKELVDQLSGDSLTQAVEFMERLRNPSLETLNSEETSQERSLLEIIQRRLSREEQVRLTNLRQKQDEETLTDEEHQELLTFVERIEQQDAERAAALVQLAKLRQVDLKTVIAEFLPSRLPNAS
ncbi:MAG: hypothetical protein NW220_16850 [Leptolyngbyaceae cyanobacterium bins.349]|nr:hypothetical protein [Leptolyngbyaceae cyanobacterium bins.349]